MPSIVVRYNETDIVKIVLEFLENRGLGISQLAMERETGVINGMFSDDMLFIRQLVLEGQWDDVLEFIQPLTALNGFDCRAFQYVIYKHKFLELLCIKSDTSGALNYELTVEALVQCMNKLEEVCPSKEEYNGLCLLLTLPKLSDHVMYRQWNPSNARIECFKAVYQLVEKYMSLDEREKKHRNRSQLAKDDRLVQLLIKGLLYESCVEYCQLKATANDKTAIKDVKLSTLLSNAQLSEADLCLLSWLQAIPNDTYNCPFEEKGLNLDVTHLERPTLEAAWSEQILMAPVRPNMYPYTAVPKPRKSDLVSKSLNPRMDSEPAYDLNTLKDGQNTRNRLVTHSYAAFSLPANERERKRDSSVDKLFTASDRTANLIANGQKATAPRLSVNVAQKAVNPSVPFSPPASPLSRPPSVARVSSTPTPTEPKFVMQPPASSADLYKQFQMQRKQFDDKMAGGRETRHPQADQGESTTTSEIARFPVNSAVGGAQASQPPPPSFVRTTQRQRSLSVDRGQSDRTTNDALVQQPTQRKQWSKPGMTAIGNSGDSGQFVKLAQLEDAQAIRAVTFHPSGNIFALGSNSKTVRLCAYPTTAFPRESTAEPRVLQKVPKYHKGSIYCMAWSPSGSLIASGSNDKLIKLMHFNIDNPTETGPTVELAVHDGTVRDLMFLGGDSSVVSTPGGGGSKQQSAILVSGGAGDCKAYVTDCSSGSVIRKMIGHSGHIYSVFTWGHNMFVTGSQDKTARIWDTRTSMSIDIIPSSSKGSAFASVAVDASGRVLAAGHEDGSCMLWDIRGNRSLQTFTPHTDEVRSVRFSPSAFYLLSASYDGKVILSDLRGDLLRPLPTVVVAEHTDKVIQCRWHPHQLAFVSTSADKTAVCWWLPTVA